jgi:glutamyl-tRNA synthetase
MLILRIEDLDGPRCQPKFMSAMFEDLTWFGLGWQEGPDVGGPFGPYCQSERLNLYRSALQRLQESGCVYPCTCSRQDVLRAMEAPHLGEDEPLYPGTCRPRSPGNSRATSTLAITGKNHLPVRINWRFSVPDGQIVQFTDGHYGAQSFTAGSDFGDFVVWRHDDLPAYHLAVVVDDFAMKISEIVRGADLLKSTARQLLLYQALGWSPPRFYHCPLMTDERGVRLAKRDDALSLRSLRAGGANPAELRKSW